MKRGLHTVEVNPHIAIASDGISAGSNSMLIISSNAAAGPVLPTAFISVVPAPLEGAILSSNLTLTRASCTFNGYEWICTSPPAIAGSPAEIGLSFALKGAVALGEVVSLKLPGFTGDSIGIIPVTGEHALPQTIMCFALSPPHCHFPLANRDFSGRISRSPTARAGAQIVAPSGGTAAYPSHPHGCTSNDQCSLLSYTGNGFFRSATWSSATSTVTLTASTAVPARTPVTAVIPIAAKVSVPTSGVRAPGANKALLGIALWDADPLISTTAADGPFPTVPPASLVPVGFFAKSELRFSSAVPGLLRTLYRGFRGLQFLPSPEYSCGYWKMASVAQVLCASLLSLDGFLRVSSTHPSTLVFILCPPPHSITHSHRSLTPPSRCRIRHGHHARL